ncbi:MAG: hypothetical protein H6983_10560 [Ectothiorhodospiraceae bacterium]|nr:hypothetical protein [Chromatiales bacterium]MCP5154598.1 hypothetical protein [Ectothiorhodospiraceae bacterium]
MPSTVQAQQLPPIRYTGRLQSATRAFFPQDGDEVIQLSRELQVNLDTFIWQPWFATLTTTATVAQSNTYAATDSDSLALAGGFTVGYFPQSHFPGTVFFNVTDSSADFESTVVREPHNRTMTFGLTQRYRPPGINADISGRLQRDIDQGGEGLDAVRDNLNLQLAYGMPGHRFQAELDAQQQATDFLGSSQKLRDVVATFNHDYRPDDWMSVQSFLSASNSTLDTDFGDAATTSFTLNSVGSWRSQERPLSATGSLRMDSTTSESRGFDTSTQSVGAALGANYDFTDDLRLNANADASYSVSDGGPDVTSSFQSASLTYAPDAFDLLGFNYGWSTSLSGNNVYSSLGQTAQSVGLSAGHSLNRIFAFESIGGFTLTMSANQSGSVSYDTVNADSETVNHGLSFALARGSARSQSSARLDLNDNRSFGNRGASGSDTALQSANFQVTHTHALGPYASLSASASMSVVRQVREEDTDTFQFSSAGVTYRHGRLFGVRRLRLTSELRARADSLTFVTTGDPDGDTEISAEARLDYRVGLLDLRFSATYTDNDGQRDAAVLLTITRSFGGIF